LIVTRDLWLCIGGWAYIVIRRPYVIGDRIQFGAITGDVIDIRLMETNIMEVTNTEGGLTTGRVIYFPNSKIFTEIIATASRQFAHIFQELHVHLDSDANWEKAAGLLEEMARNEYKTALAAKEQLAVESEEVDLLAGYREPRVLTEMQNGHIVLHLQFMAPTGQVANMTDRIWRAFLKAAAADASIKFAAP
jgi:small-conductance mechanosensitive channel